MGYKMSVVHQNQQLAEVSVTVSSSKLSVKTNWTKCIFDIRPDITNRKKVDNPSNFKIKHPAKATDI